MTLDKLKPGQSGRVLELDGNDAVRKRMMDMGITKDALIKVKKLAPLGDPMEVSVRGYSLAIRKEDAKRIQLKV